MAELNEIATNPDAGHVMTVNDFSKLSTIKAAFAKKTCAGKESCLIQNINNLKYPLSTVVYDQQLKQKMLLVEIYQFGNCKKCLGIICR